MIELWQIVVGAMLLGAMFVMFLRHDKQLKKDFVESFSAEVVPNELPSIPAPDTVDFDKLVLKYAVDPASYPKQDVLSKRKLRLLTTTGANALNLWVNLRASTDTSGFWPVILGSKEDLDALVERLAALDPSPENIIANAASIDAEAWFGSRLSGDQEYFKAPQGAWLKMEKPNDNFNANIDNGGSDFLAEVYLALVPTSNPWEVPAYLRFGGWNLAPKPEAHVAVLKRWHGMYGGEIVALTNDTMEMRATTPPTNKDSALLVANEQFLYCPDIVHQGAGGLHDLGSMLYRSHQWYFWWD